MANPFLVLGGIAISVATAAFGILQVPGWVASAQDAAAINDITQVTQAQAVALAERGEGYMESMGELAASGSVKVTASGGVTVHTATNPTRTEALVVARSASGKFFSRLSAKTTVGSGPTIEDAIVRAGTTISGPATARVTAEGINVPTRMDLASEFYTNLFRNSDITNTAGFSMFWGGDAGAGTREAVDAEWAHNGRAVRFSPSAVGSQALHFDLVPPSWMEPGKRYTLAWDIVGPGTYSSPGTVLSYPHGVRVTGSPTDDQVVGSTPRRVWATFDMPASINNSWQAYINAAVPVGSWIEFGNVEMYEGDYDPKRPWFSGSTSAPGSHLTVEWTGVPNSSPAAAYR